MKVGLTLPYHDEIPMAGLIELARLADRLGYETLWVPEGYGWDAFVVLTEMAVATRRIALATGVVNVFSRSPALIAQSAASLDRASGGRFILGLGTSGPQVVQGWHGMPFERGVRRLRETVEIVRLALSRERLVYRGEVFRIEGGLKLLAHPLRSRIPVYLATLTPTGMALAGELADGWLPAFFSPRHFDAVMRPDLEKGAAAAGRMLADLRICLYLPACVTDDRAAGRDAVRPQLGLYVGGMGSRQKNYYNALFKRYGFEAEARRVQDLFLAGQRQDAIRAVTDEMVDLVSLVGPAAECRERLRALEQAGVDEVALVLSTPGGGPRDLAAALEALAPA